MADPPLLTAHWQATKSGIRFAETLQLTRQEPYAMSLHQGIRAEQHARSAVRGGTRRRQILHCHDDGPRDARAVVLLNGWTASGLLWPNNLLTELGHFRVLRVDNRGTGRSRPTDWPFTISDLAGDVRRALADVGVERAVFVGFSLGGMIAQEFALRWPGMVERLILVSTRPPSPLGRSGDPALFDQLLNRTTDPDAYVAAQRERLAAISGPGFAAAHPEMIDEFVTAAIRQPTPPRVVLSQARAVAAWYGARRLRDLRPVTVVVHGAADPLTPAVNGRRLAGLIPAACYIELPGIGHLLPYEAPDTLAHLLLEDP